MTLKLRCEDYGFECKFEIDEEKSVALIKKLRNHFEEESMELIIRWRQSLK